MQELDPVTVSPLPAGIMLSVVSGGHYRKEGLFPPGSMCFLSSCSCGEQQPACTRHPISLVLSKCHWQPRRQLPSKCEIPRVFCGHPRVWFPTGGTWSNLSTIQWTTVPPSPTRPEPQPRSGSPLPNVFLLCTWKAYLLLSSTHNTSDTNQFSKSQTPTVCPTIQSWH